MFAQKEKKKGLGRSNTNCHVSLTRNYYRCFSLPLSLSLSKEKEDRPHDPKKLGRDSFTIPPRFTISVIGFGDRSLPRGRGEDARACTGV